jgi:hypothetical protein
VEERWCLHNTTKALRPEAATGPLPVLPKTSQLRPGPSSSIEISTTFDPRPSPHSHHVVKTGPAPLSSCCSSLAGGCLPSSLLRRRRRRRARQASRRPLRPRWHLCHRPGTSPRRVNPVSEGFECRLVDRDHAIDALGPPAGQAETSEANASFCSITQYTAAVKSSSVDPTATALNKLGNLVSQDAKLATILDAPTLSPADKSAIVAELEKTAGTNPTVKNFLQTLAENNRLGLLGGVCSKFGELMSAARGEVEMTVTSATVCVLPYEREERRFLLAF